MAFEKLMDRLERQASDMAERTRSDVADAAAQFPDISVERDGNALIISGRGLMRRWITDARLRFSAGGWL